MKILGTLLPMLLLAGCGKSVKTTVTHCGKSISVYSDNSLSFDAGTFEKACVKNLSDGAVSAWNGIYRAVGSTCGFWSTPTPTAFVDNYAASVATDLVLTDTDSNTTFEYVVCE